MLYEVLKIKHNGALAFSLSIVLGTFSIVAGLVVEVLVMLYNVLG